MNIENKEQWSDAFIAACNDGHLEDVRHLCQKQYLDSGWADIHVSGELGFRWACSNGHLDVVKYLLTSPELIEAGHVFANLHIKDENGFRGACLNGYLDVVKYLLTSPELIEAGHTFADLHGFSDLGFRLACRNERWNVVRWLVLDYGIEKTQDIEKIIQEYPQAKEYFRVREELNEIQALIKETSIYQDDLKEDELAAKKANKL